MSLIDSIAAPVNVTRYGAGVFVKGRWVDGASQTLTIAAAIQPEKPTEIVDPPQGVRVRGAIKLYSETSFQIADRVARVRADDIAYNGQTYQVHSSDLYQGFGLLAYKAVAILVDPVSGV